MKRNENNENEMTLQQTFFTDQVETLDEDPGDVIV